MMTGGVLSAGVAAAITGSGATLQQFMTFTTPGATVPPLDTAVRWDRVDPPGVESGGTGNIGINFDAAHYNMGIDLADNSLRLNANQKILLERFGTVYLRYNACLNRVEIVKNNVVVASW